MARWLPRWYGVGCLRIQRLHDVCFFRVSDVAHPRQLDAMAAGEFVATLPGARRAVRLREIFFGENVPPAEIAKKQGGVVWH